MRKENTNIGLDPEIKQLAKLKGINLSQLFNDVLKNIVYDIDDNKVDEDKINKIKELIEEKENIIKKVGSELHQLKNSLAAYKSEQEEINKRKMKEFSVFAKAAKEQDLLEGFGK